MKKTITLLTILMLVVFMVGCEKSMNPIQSQGQNDNDGISLGKKGVAQEATFKVTFNGDVYGPLHTWTQKLSSGAKRIGTPHGFDIELNLNLFDCINGLHVGPLQVGKSTKKNVEHLAFVWFWFDVTTDESTITYLLKMYGDFESETWPPLADGPSINITLINWELATEGKRNKNACTGNGVFSTEQPTVVTVARVPFETPPGTGV